MSIHDAQQVAESALKRRIGRNKVRSRLCSDGVHCDTCRYRVRGPNHEQGSHHRKKRP